MEVAEAQLLKALEDENRRLKMLVAELSLQGEILKTVIRKTGGACGLREDVALAMAEHRLSERTACKLLELERSSYRYEPRPGPQPGTARRVVAAGPAEAGYGIGGCMYCSSGGHKVNVKRVYRLYLEEA